VTDYLLDTSFLIAYFNEVADRQDGPARAFWAMKPGRARLYVSIVTLSELLEGAENPDEVEGKVFEAANVLGLHRQHARRAGLMQRRAREAGRRMGENDAWIAATAALANLKIVGDDDNAFAGRPAVTYSNFRAATP
jgi:predicted nucleic acid-binding protein